MQEHPVSPKSVDQSQNNKRESRLEEVESVPAPAGKDSSIAVVRVVSYLLLGMSSFQGSLRPHRDANPLDHHSLAQRTLGSLEVAKSMARSDFESNAQSLDTQMKKFFSVTRPVSRKRRFRRRCRRRVPRETYLSKLDKVDRDLEQDEFETLVRDLAEPPFRVEEYDEVMEVQDKATSIVPSFALLCLPKKLSWKFPPFSLVLPPWEEYDEELSASEEQLLFESSDAWIEAKAHNVQTVTDDPDDDKLTEMDMWILRDASGEVGLWDSSDDCDGVPVNADVLEESSFKERDVARLSSTVASHEPRKNLSGDGGPDRKCLQKENHISNVESVNFAHGELDSKPFSGVFSGWWRRRPLVPHVTKKLDDPSRSDDVLRSPADAKFEAEALNDAGVPRDDSMNLGESASGSVLGPMGMRRGQEKIPGQHDSPNSGLTRFQYVRED